MINVSKKNLLHFCRELRDGVADIAIGGWKFATTPSAWSEKLRVMADERHDAGLQAKLNRQIRSQFIQAFNNSARKKMTVEVNDLMQSYKSRNSSFFAALMKPYEIFSHWSAPAKIATLFALSRGLRVLLTPVIGVWGMAVPLTVFVVQRMAQTYKHAANKRQENELAQNGLLTPCNFIVQEGAVTVSDRVITAEDLFGFPVMNKAVPEWITSRYDADSQSLTAPETIHAATFEALRLKRLSQDDIETIANALPGQAQRDCAYAFSILFPDQDTEQNIDKVRGFGDARLKMPGRAVEKKGLSAIFADAALPVDGMRDASMAEAVLRVLEPFCLSSHTDKGLIDLSGKVMMEDLLFLAELQNIGIALTGSRAAEIKRMMKDARFSDSLSFHNIVDIAVWPEKQAQLFDDLWKDRSFRSRFTFDDVKDMVLHSESWGGVALRLTSHTYTQSLSGPQIIELASPENAHWAKVYHSLRLSPDLPPQTPHDVLKKAVQQFGLLAADHLPNVKTRHACPSKKAA